MLKSPVSYLPLLFLPCLLSGQEVKLGLPAGHTNMVHNLIFAQDGRTLFSGSEDESLMLWEVESGKLLKQSVKANGSVTPGAIASPNLRYVQYAKGWTDGRYLLFSFDQPESRGKFFGYDYPFHSFSADEQWGITLAGKLASTANPSDTLLFPAFQPDGYTPDGKHFYKITSNQLRLWDADSRELAETQPIEGLRPGASFMAYGEILSAPVPQQANNYAESYEFWLAGNGQRLYEMEVPENYYWNDIAQDGSFVILTSSTGEVRKYDPRTEQFLLTYNFPSEPPEEFMFERPAASKISPDGKLLARGRADGTIYLQDIDSGALIRTFRSHNWAPSVLQFSSEGHHLLCGTAEGTARLWDFEQGRVTQSAGLSRRLPPRSSKMLAIGEREVLVSEASTQLAKIDLRAGSSQPLCRLKPDSYDRLQAYSPQREEAYLSGYDEDFQKVTKAYNLQQLPPQIEVLSDVQIKGVAPDGKTALSFGRTMGNYAPARPLLLDLESKALIKKLEAVDLSPYQPEQVVFSKGQRKVLLLHSFELKEGTTSYVWDIPSGRLEHALYDPEDSYATCGALSDDGRYLLLGNWNRSIHYYDLSDGQLLHTFKGHQGRITTVAFSPDGKKMASGAEDGTVKVWDLERRKELASLIHIDQADWVVLSPNGLFDASQRAMGLLYYLADTDGRTEVIELNQLKARYYEPGLLQKLMGYGNERLRSVEGLEQVALYPNLNAEIEGDELKVQLRPRAGGIGRAAIFVNGKEVSQDANPGRAAQFAYDLRKNHKLLLRHPDSTNQVSVQVHNEAGWLKSRLLHLSYQPKSWARGQSGSGSSSWEAALDPKMYVVTVGTSDYSGEALDLQYAAQDATVMALALEAVSGNLFAGGDSLEVYCLTTASERPQELEGSKVAWKFASKANLQAVLSGIRQSAKAEDVLLLYLSGHGLAYGSGEASQFYYLTHSIASLDMISDAEVRKQYTLSSSELATWLQDIPALKQVLVVDACNSGKVVESLTSGARNLNASQIRALDRMKDRTGTFVLSGSAADKVSYEASEYGQGLLTYALLNGMMGLAARVTADGQYVDVMELFQHARDEVPRLAASIKGIQTPMLGFPAQAASFDIGIIEDQQSIPIGNRKPVLIRSNILNQQTLQDDLNLVGRLEAALREENERGKNADFIYVDVSEYPNAYSLSGLYTKEEGDIQLRLRLFKNGGDPVDLDIRPNSDPERVAEDIKRAIKGALNH